MSSSGRRRDLLLWVGAAAGVCGIVGVVCLARLNLELAPALALGAVGLTALVLALISPYFRLLGFVGVALLVLQSDTGALASAKPVYLAFILVASIAGAMNMTRLDPAIRRAYRPIIVGAALALSLVALEAVGSILGGMDPSRVVRDGTTYVMLAAAPLIGADAARSGHLKRARGTIALFTLVSAVGFAAFWLSARGAGSLGVDKFGLTSFFLPACGFVVGLAYGLVRRKFLWVALAMLCLLGVLVTGTRSGLVMLVAVAALVGSERSSRAPLSRMVVGLIGLGLALVFTFPAVINAVTTQNFFESRVAAMSSVLSEGIASDQSGAIRLRALGITLKVWNGSPLFGVGFGYSFPSPSPDLPPSDFQLDSPGLVLAKFGIIGAGVLLAVLVLFVRGIARFHVETGIRSEAQPAGLGMILVTFAFCFLGLPFEDKGSSLAFALIFYLLGCEATAAKRLPEAGGKASRSASLAPPRSRTHPMLSSVDDGNLPGAKGTVRPHLVGGGARR